jgi:hypothetical protein
VDLPLVFMPVLLTTSRPLAPKAARFILHGFIFSTLFCCIVSWAYWFKHSIVEMREISLFVDHIRFSLCVVLSFVLSVAFMLQSDTAGLLRSLYALLALLFFVYTIFSHTMTGIVCILVLIFCYAVWQLIVAPKKQKWQSGVVLTLILVLCAYLVVITVQFFDDKDRIVTTMETSAGNTYTFDLNTPLENGHRIGYYVCEDELLKAWVLRSDSVLTEGRENVLIRYLNSKGLHKDYEALMSLEHKDILNIEKGVPNYLYPRNMDFRSTLYPTYFSISLYQCCGYIENSSLLERLELWKASWQIYKQHPLLGIGLGDDKDELDAQLEAQNSSIAHKKQRGCHNQMLTFGLMCGLPIIVYFVFMMVYPFVWMRKQVGYVYVGFVMMMLMSMVIEDTLGSQAGRLMFSVMLPLLLLYWPEQKVIEG